MTEHIYKIHTEKNKFPGGAVVKNPPAVQEVQETQVQSLGLEDSLEEGMATRSSVLAYRIPWTEEPGGLQSMGLQRVTHNRSDLAHTHTRNHASGLNVQMRLMKLLKRQNSVCCRCKINVSVDLIT